MSECVHVCVCGGGGVDREGEITGHNIQSLHKPLIKVTDSTESTKELNTGSVYATGNFYTQTFCDSKARLCTNHPDFQSSSAGHAPPLPP